MSTEALEANMEQLCTCINDHRRVGELHNRKNNEMSLP